VTQSKSTRICTTCGEEIAASARKCIHCDSYQDWRRYFVFSQSVLALLVALVSVTAVAGPVIRDLLITKDSRLVGSFLGVIDNEAVFTVVNSGNRPGSVGEARVLIPDISNNSAIVGPGWRVGGPPASWHLRLAPNPREEAFFVDAGQNKVIKYKPPATEVTPPPEWDPSAFVCFIQIDLTNFSGKRSSPCFVSDCGQLLPIAIPGVSLKRTGQPTPPTDFIRNVLANFNCGPESAQMEAIY